MRADAWLWVAQLGGLVMGSAAQSGHVLVVDAGSSGSRLRMFRMSSSGMEEVLPPKEDAHRFETEPGLSDFADNPSEAGASLHGLLDAAKSYIPAWQHASTKLWVKATAGMRLLETAKLQAVIDNVDQYLAHPAASPFKHTRPEVLAGEEEAVFMYLSANYVLNKLSLPPGETSGILDMGGASLQIAFRPPANILEHSFDFYVHGQRRAIYTKSHIQFGINAAVARAKAALLTRSFPGGAMRPVPAPVPGGGAAAPRQLQHPCFNRGYSEVDDVGGVQVNFTGSGDSAGCSELVAWLLHRDTECLLPPCSVMGVHVSPLGEHGQFLAVSNFFRLAVNLGLVGKDEAKVLAPAQFEQAATLLCGKSRDEAIAGYDVPWKYLRTTCFGGHYVHQMLLAFGFQPSAATITFAGQTRGHNADWTLGAALFETQFMPVSLQSRLGPCGAILAANHSFLGLPVEGLAVALVVTSLLLVGVIVGSLLPRRCCWQPRKVCHASSDSESQELTSNEH